MSNFNHSKISLKSAITLLFLALFCGYFSYSQCTVPTAVDSSRCGPGIVPLTVSGGTKSLYNWYDASSGGNLVGTGSLYNTPSISVKDTFYVAQYDTGTTTKTLVFSGASDYIAIEDYNYSAAGHTELTVECWIKKSTDAGNYVLASYDRNRYWRLEINGSGATAGKIGFDLMTDAGQLDFGSASRVDDNSWHHIAAVYDDGNVTIYIDGAADATTNKGTSFGDGSDSYGFVGTGSEASTFDGNRGPNSYYVGEMDEFRIWSVARSIGDISSNMNNCLSGSQLGLEVYYRMDGTATTDSVIDYSLNQRHGQLKNFAYPAAWAGTGPNIFTCDTCESSRDMAIADLKILPTPSLGNDTCAIDTFQLDAGANYTSYTWNTGETTQTIDADTSKFYFVTVDSAGTTCLGTDGITVNLLTRPIGTDTSRCGPGTVTLTAVGGSGKYYWYDSAVGGIVKGQGTPWTSATVSETDTFYLASIENDTTRQGLTFDGIDDYVSLDMFFNTVGALPTMTVEAWVKTTESGGAYTDNWSIIDFDRSEYFAFFVHGGNGTVGFSTADDGGTIDDFYSPTTATVNDGQWHHVVGVYNGTDKKIYVDGSLVATKANAHGGKPLGDGTIRYGIIGDGSEATSENGARNNLYFKGEVDEVRLWSDERNLLEIQNNKDACILGVESNLLAYYKMENGAGSSTLTDHSNQGRVGTLRNMNTSSSWTETGPYVTCSCGDSPRDTVAVEIKVVPTVNLGVDTCVLTPLLLDAGSGMSSYTWQDGSTTQTLSATTSQAYHVAIDSVGATCTGRDTIVVNVGKAANPTSTDSSRCGNGIVTLKGTGQGKLKWYDSAVGGTLLGTSDSINVGPLTGDSTFYYASTFENKNALEFDGIDDIVEISNFFYDSTGLTELTVEAWIKTNSNANQIVASFDRSDYWRLEIGGDAAAAGKVGFGILTDAGVLDLGGNITVTNGQWHHIAAVYNNGTATIYVDGAEDVTANSGTTWGSGNTRYGFLGNGSEATSYPGGAQGPDYYFNGQMDDIRIWSTARSEANILLYQDSCLLSTEPNLDLYYRFSSGSGSTVSDFAGTAHGAITEASWVNNARGYACSACSESDRISITATIHEDYDSLKSSLSCPSAAGTNVLIEPFGASGKYDYREISGVLNYSGSYSTGQSVQWIPNGGNFDIEVKDENGCLDTIAGVVTNPNPDLNSISGTDVSNSCLIPGENGWFYLVNSGNEIILSINPNDEDLGTVTANVFVTGTAQSTDTTAYMRRNYVITPEFQPTSNVLVRIYFSDGDYNNLVAAASATVSEDDDISSLADLAITKYQGSSEDGTFDTTGSTSILFIPQTSNGTQFGQKYIEFSTPSFSEIWVHGSKKGDPLPVELIDFSGELVGSDIELQWTTASEINSNYFQVERSTDGIKFGTIGNVIAAGLSMRELHYNYIDFQPEKGNNFYRLKMVDRDGSWEYSSIAVVVKIHEESNKGKIVIYPNPNNGDFIIKIQDIDLKGTYIKLEIYSTKGELVYKALQPSTYDSTFSFNIKLPESIKKGIYHIRVNDGLSQLDQTIVVQ